MRLARRFWSTLDMRLIRGADALLLVDDDGRRVCFRSETPIPENGDESAVVWAPRALQQPAKELESSTPAEQPAPETEQNPKSEFSKIRTVKRTLFCARREYYLLIREFENRQFLFEKETGKLLEIRDHLDNFAALEYDEYGGTRGRLKRVVDNRGIFLLFDSAPGSLTGTDPMGLALARRMRAGEKAAVDLSLRRNANLRARRNGAAGILDFERV